MISNEPIVGAKAVVAQTRQEGVSQAGGLLELRLPATFGPGSEVKVSVTYKDLVIHEPFDGDVTVPANPNKVVVIRMGPKGSTGLLANSGRQIVAASIRQQDAPPSAGAKTPPEGKLTRYIREWASEYGFGVEEVQAEVRRWADEVEKKRAGTSMEDGALAAYARGQFEEAAALFKDAAASALPRFEEARRRRATAEDTERKELRAYLDGVVGEADSLKRAFHYREAREALDGAIAQVDRGRYRSWWVEVVTRRAASLVAEGEFGAPGTALARLDAAIEDYRDLLHELAGAGDRRDWAGTQGNLGNALETQGELSGQAEGNELLARAVEAYRTALHVFTKADLPRDWALTQNSLGIALERQGERSGGAEGAALLAQAVEAYRAALQVRTRADLPQQWAMTQNNLGVALQVQGERSSGAERTALLAQAVEAYRAALQVRTKADLPQDWATTQNNLGGALERQGAQSSGAEGTALLAQAVEAYRAALQIRTEATLPQDWAATQYNLGIVLRSQGERSSGEEGTALLAQAAEADRAALRVYTKANLPWNWAMTQNNLGLALQSQGERSSGAEGTALLAQAVEAYRAALQVRAKADSPQDWARTQSNLGSALEVQGMRSSGAERMALMAQAVEAFRANLRVYTKADSPQQWETTQYNLGIALTALSEWAGADEAFGHALEIDSNDIDTIQHEEAVVHDHLFDFARAFELSKHWVELDASVSARMDFLEQHLTTARFHECVDLSAQFTPKELEGRLEIIRDSLRFACQVGAGDPGAGESAENLIKLSAGLKKADWSFAGTRHFLGEHPAFAVARASWVKLFERLEAGDGAGVADAVREIQKSGK